MSINGQQIINIGLPNESAGSDSLYEAFNKTEDNFTTLFTCASPYTNFVALTGISVNSNANAGTVSITNTGVTNIIAGTNITINQSNGNVTISSTGGGNGGGSGTVTSVGLAPVSNSRIVVTNSPIVSSGNIGIDLATTGVVPGTYTAPTVTLDAYGRITSAANTTSSGTVTSVGIIPGSGIGVASSPVTTVGNVTVTNTGVVRLTAGLGITLSAPNGIVQVSSVYTGTVTSVGISSNTLTVSSSPITASGNIAVELPSSITLSGNITAANGNLGNLATANFFSGDGGLLSNLAGAVGTQTTIANGTSNVRVFTNGNVTTSVAGNANIVIVTGTGANIAGTANISGNANVGNIGASSGVFTSNVTSGNVYANSGTVGASLLAGTLTTAAQPNITSVGTLGSLTVTGKVTAGQLQGDGGNISNIQGGNVSGAVATATTAATVTTAAQPNITSVGTLTSLTTSGNTFLATSSGNVGINTTNPTSALVVGGSQAGNAGLEVVPGSGVVLQGYNRSTSAYTSLNLDGATIGFRPNGSTRLTVDASGANVTGTFGVSGNANVGNLGTAGLVVATGNVTGGNLVTGGVVAATGNVVAGNLYANSGTLGVAILNVSGISNLNAVGNVRISGGSANQILKTDGAGNLTWVDPNGGYYLHTQNSSSSTWTVTHNLNRQYVTVEAIDANGNSYTGRYDYPTINYTNANALTMTFASAVQGYAAVTGGGTNINSVSVGNSTPGGVNTQVQFNDAGALAGSSGLVYNKTTGTLTATLYAGSGANLTNIAGANVTGAVSFASTANAVAGANVSGTVSSATTAATVTTAAQPNITSVGTLANLNVSGNVSFTGSNVSLGSNANVRITGGSSGQILSTDGSGNLSWVPTGTATTAATVTTNAQPNITSVGTLTSLSVSGNISGANLTGNHFGNGASLSSITGANVTGTVPTANNSAFLGGTAAASYLLTTGTGSSLTAIAGANVTGTVANATTVTGATQNNITTLGALTVLSSGANTTAGTITGNWSLSTGSRLSATYADLAEYYQADATYEPGTVLMFGGDNEVTLAEEATNRVAGVVSTNPAYAMNSGCPDIAVAIALQGRVPCKVQGTVRKGDMMISAGSGYAVACSEPRLGQVIGKALENFDLSDGVIEIVVGRL